MSELAKSLNGLPNFPFFNIFCSFTPLRKPRSPSKCNQFFIVPFRSSTYKISLLPVQNMLSNISQTNKPTLHKICICICIKYALYAKELITIVVASNDRGARNDPEGIGLAFHHQPKALHSLVHIYELLQTWLIEIAANMKIMILEHKNRMAKMKPGEK